MATDHRQRYSGAEAIRGDGKCGQHSVIVSGPMFKQVDLSVVKRVPLRSRLNAELHIDCSGSHSSARGQDSRSTG
jgi:hypothetical protein